MFIAALDYPWDWVVAACFPAIALLSFAIGRYLRRLDDRNQKAGINLVPPTLPPTKQLTPYQDGQKARHAGARLVHNPFVDRYEPEKFDEWRRGWLSNPVGTPDWADDE